MADRNASGREDCDPTKQRYRTLMIGKPPRETKN
jgi:hypothetical protein